MRAWSAALLLARLALPAAAQPAPSVPLLARPRAEGSGDLLRDLPAALGQAGAGEAFRAAAVRDLPELEAQLLPTFAALPKSEAGRLGPTAVRYTLHRLFLRRYGWNVKGLDPEGRAWNSTSPSNLPLLAQAPSAARSLVGGALAGSGLDLRGLAALAALVEHLVHQQAVERLRAVYSRGALPQLGARTASEAGRAMEIYAASYTMGLDPVSTNWSALVHNWAYMSDQYPNWPKVRQSVRELVQKQAKDGQMDFEGSAEVVRGISHGFGDWEMSECQAMKDRLVKMEDRGTGRVRLADFYSKALHEGIWQHSESLPYLRQLGTLDESNPGNLRVVLPNYVLGASNCLATSPYISVCCMSECEGVLGRLEAALGAPEAAPQQLLVLVASLNSSTVRANRSLSPVMHHRLNNIAAANNGMVPLYGRLFAQWLHHAFPRECPYPHLAGTTRPGHPEAWSRSTGLDYFATADEMEEHAGAVPSTRPRLGLSRPLESAPWSYEEELFVPRHAATGDRPMGLLAMHAAMMVSLMAIATFGLVVARTARAAKRAVHILPADVAKLYPV